MSPGLYNPATSYHDVLTSLKASIFGTDTAEGGYLTRLNQFQQFWRDRAVSDSTASSGSGHNMFAKYHTALRRGVAERMLSDCGTSGFRGNWKCLGPHSLVLQTIGFVSCVWADSANENHVLAGTK